MISFIISNKLFCKNILIRKTAFGNSPPDSHIVQFIFHGESSEFSQGILVHNQMAKETNFPCDRPLNAVHRAPPISAKLTHWAASTVDVEKLHSI